MRTGGADAVCPRLAGRVVGAVAEEREVRDTLWELLATIFRSYW